MIKSMTGYGRAQEEKDNKLITVEIKSVNHRFFDFSIRCPRVYGYLEDAVKSFINKKISRGKLDVYVNIESTGEEPTEVLLNKPLLAGYLNAFKQIEEQYGLMNDVAVSSLIENHDVFTVKKAEEEQAVVTNCVMSVAEKALDDLLNLRNSEGQQLYNDIKKRCDRIYTYIDEIEK